MPVEKVMRTVTGTSKLLFHVCCCAGLELYSVHFRGGYRDTIEVDVRHQGTAVGLGISHARLRCSLTGMSAVTYLDN